MLPYREIWAVDFEFVSDPGCRPLPVCLVARELKTGRLIRLWRDELPDRPPYSIDADSVFIAYYASAELGCHLALGWPMPARVIDLFAEFRVMTNGKDTAGGRSLLDALSYHGLAHIDCAYKAEVIEKIQVGGLKTAAEREEILTYCESDVNALAALLPRMAPQINANSRRLGQALLRGRYMTAAARIEHTGVPVDVATLKRLRRHWTGIKTELITEIDKDYAVYDGTTFKADRFEGYLARNGIPWPRLASGRLDLARDTFREMAKTHICVAPLRELRHSLSELRLNDLAVSFPEGRNRCLLSAFQSRTGRNQPSNSKFIFGPSTWLRALIKPDPGKAVAYIDWSSQELAIAASLSGDQRLTAACASGDPYITFAIQAGLAPIGSTKRTHSEIRDRCKIASLAILYGMREQSLAARLGVAPAEARYLLDLHRTTYPVFWAWSQGAVDTAMLTGQLVAPFGWTVHVGRVVNPRSLANSPMQSGGSEMLRIACCLATERGVQVNAPVHDALMIEAPKDQLDDAVATTKRAMAEASRAVLGGFEIGTDAKVVFWPHRYIDQRGVVMWNRVRDILGRVEGARLPFSHVRS
jgi:DNA polymerase I